MTTNPTYGASTHAAKNRLIRYVHGRRFRFALSLIDPQPGDRFLDIGAGDGHLLRLCRQACADAGYTGLEPYKSGDELAAGDGIGGVTAKHELGGTSLNKIGCFEVLEHLSDASIDDVLETVGSHLGPGGQFIVSVPIEIGPPAAAKNAIGLLLGRRRKNVTFANIAWSVLGRTDRIPRVGDRLPHMGFDYRRLRDRIQSHGGLTLSRTRMSPWPWLPAWANSQVFWVFTRVN